jgi:protein SCO1/2
VLVLAYYKCPHLCNQVLNGVLDVLRTADAPEGDPIFGTQRTLRREPPGSTQPVPRLKWHAGQEFTVVTVSFDPGEKSLLAGHKKQSYLTELKQDWTTAERGWRFLTGEKVAIERLADSVGFHYAFNAKTKQFDHPSGIVVVTPEGKVSRYFFGVDFPAERLQAALEGRSEEAGQKETSVVSLLCSMFSPAPGKYSSVVMAVVKTSSVLTAFGLAGFVAWLALRKPRVPAGEAGGTPGLPAAGTGG